MGWLIIINIRGALVTTYLNANWWRIVPQGRTGGVDERHGVAMKIKWRRLGAVLRMIASGKIANSKQHRIREHSHIWAKALPISFQPNFLERAFAVRVQPTITFHCHNESAVEKEQCFIALSFSDSGIIMALAYRSQRACHFATTCCAGIYNEKYFFQLQKSRLSAHKIFIATLT